MSQFPLKVAGQTLTFDTDGRVMNTAADVVGQWTTAANKIQLRPAGGGTATPIDVVWAFNSANQLTVSQGSQLVLTIRNSADGIPRFRLVKNELVVDPDGDGNFEFRLACLFGLDGDGNLLVSIEGKQSVLDGFIEDSKSRFRFQFFDASPPSVPSSLVFSGQWERKAAGDDKSIRLHFLLDDPALEIKSKPLDLPAAVRVDPATNHLSLLYKSKSNGQRQLQFLGSVQLRPDFTLVFRIDDVKDGGVRKSRIEVETTFDWEVAQGAMTLYVGKTKGPNAQMIEVGGTLQAQLKNDGTLSWTFDYRKSTAGGQATTTIATALQFVFQDNKIMISYQQDGKTKSVDVSARFTQDNFTVGGGVAIAQDPRGRSVKAFLTVAF